MDSLTLHEGIGAVDFDAVHRWLAAAYWSPGIPKDRVERAAKHSSLVVVARVGGEPAGYLRVVSDQTTFAWICDVIVDERFRGKGIGKAMVRYALDHAEHQGLRRWILATRDAHQVYADCGFEALWEPQRWMIYFPGGTPVSLCEPSPVEHNEV